MKISGFSFARNAEKLTYPIKESIQSILPICDEFIIAIGAGDADDHTREIVNSIASEKIKILDTTWDDLDSLRGNIYSQQTNIALKHCQGDWCFYLQNDEVIHEKYLPRIKQQCQEHFQNPKVEGFLFSYKHFWGDYNHYIVSHRWYQHEIRIIRNNIGITSLGDAQSFRKNGQKLCVIKLDAEIFHYGYVRHPRLMQKRNFIITSNYWGKEKTKEIFASKDELFDFGSLQNIPVFKNSYPQVMKERVAEMDWHDLLQYSGKSKVKFGHERLKYKILTFIEQKIFRGSGKQPWGFKNYRLIK